MLKRILFDITPELEATPSVRNLLCSLGSYGIHTLFSSGTTVNSLSREDSLVVTDSVSGIMSARIAGVPCIGYAPFENHQDMSDSYAVFEDFSSVDAGYFCRTHAHALGYPADILTTEHLILREFSEEDFPTLYAICTEPSTAFFMEERLADFETEKEKHNAYLHNIYPLFDLALWGVFEKSSDKLIGRAGFSLPDDNTHSFSIGYLIDVPYRRRGFAKELIPALLSYAKEQGYLNISARIKHKNIASVKALEQCGFPYERKDDTSTGIIMYHFHLEE